MMKKSPLFKGIKVTRTLRIQLSDKSFDHSQNRDRISHKWSALYISNHNYLFKMFDGFMA